MPRAKNGGAKKRKLQQGAKGKADDAAARTVHRGFGKLILFGEHFVVYKKPALVGAVKAATECEVELSEAEWSTGVIVEDLRPAVPGYKDKKADEMLASAHLVLNHFGFDAKKRGIKIVLKGDLSPVSGIGASAANCVSLARALCAALGKTDVTEEEINRAAFVGEGAYHGTPSGIDNTASTYGGLLRFKRTDGDPEFEPKSLPREIPIVYASTGITSSTTEVVGDVKRRRDEDPSWYEALEARYMEVYEAAENVLAKMSGDDGDDALKELGELASKNHAVLQELSVSCEPLDKLVAAATEAGALGAKMSGTGRGGLMFAVCADAAAQEKVAAALRENGADQVWITAFS